MLAQCCVNAHWRWLTSASVNTRGIAVKDGVTTARESNGIFTSSVRQWRRNKDRRAMAGRAEP
jgi:hypothetical protein